MIDRQTHYPPSFKPWTIWPSGISRLWKKIYWSPTFPIEIYRHYWGFKSHYTHIQCVCVRVRVFVFTLVSTKLSFDGEDIVSQWTRSTWSDTFITSQNFHFTAESREQSKDTQRLERTCFIWEPWFFHTGLHKYFRTATRLPGKFSWLFLSMQR